VGVIRLSRGGIYCKDKIPIVAKKIPQTPGGEFWLSPHKRILHSVALSVKDQQVAMVYQTIDQSGGHGLITEGFMIPLSLNALLVEHSRGVA